MFCPKCQAEYRDGFTHCSDCDVDLVESLSDASAASASLSDGLQPVWRGGSQEQCLALCERLEDARVPFKVMEQREFFTGLEQRFEIGVPANLCAQAKEIIDQANLDFPDDAAGQEGMELPAEDGPDIPEQDIPEQRDE